MKLDRREIDFDKLRPGALPPLPSLPLYRCDWCALIEIGRSAFQPSSHLPNIEIPPEGWPSERHCCRRCEHDDVYKPRAQLGGE